MFIFAQGLGTFHAQSVTFGPVDEMRGRRSCLAQGNHRAKWERRMDRFM